ncbi:MAG: DNA repair protein RadC [Desulfovibrionaceae bacterium]|nr:DNA repair protein RadC [Desulfovibrionaceae bacterium]
MAKDPHYAGHRQRLRQRLLKDPKALADYEVLEMVLGQVLPRLDTKPLAKALLAEFKDLSGVFRAPADRLAGIKGLGPAVEAHWALLAELMARLSEAPIRRGEVLSGPETVAQAAKARIGNKPREEFWVALVDNKNRVIAWEQIGAGTVDQMAVYPREVLGLALSRQASGVILVHNHPGGDPRPSREDLDLTRRMVRAAEDLGLRVLDHLVVAGTEHFSFQERGLL